MYLQTCRWNTNYVRDLNRFFIYLAGPSFLDEMEMKTKMRGKCFMLRHCRRWKTEGEKIGKNSKRACEGGGGGSIFAFWRAPVISSLRSFGVWGKMSTDWLTGRKCCEYIQIISNVRIHSSRVICYAPTNKAKWGINIRNYAAVNWLWLSHFGVTFSSGISCINLETTVGNINLGFNTYIFIADLKKIL